MQTNDLLSPTRLAKSVDIRAPIDAQPTKNPGLMDYSGSIAAILAKELPRTPRSAPKAPGSLAETDLSMNELLALLLKLIHNMGSATVSELVQAIKLSHLVVSELATEATHRALVAAAPGREQTSSSWEIRYVLSEKGRREAMEAFAQSQYVGPAPVSLRAFCDLVTRQAITNEAVDFTRIQQAFSGLAISARFIVQIGPAVNSGRTILLYGPPGNGKTSIALRLRQVFEDSVYIPYAVSIDGIVMRVFDPLLHDPIVNPGRCDRSTSIRRGELDERWVACRRPFVVAGGELTLEMLDLRYHETSKFYEAPLQVKASNGCFLIDDFGRQQVDPAVLLNRWIVPLERRIDFLKLHTGKSVPLPFDELIIFSTNLNPSELMDPAFLRRIPYKLEVQGPTEDNFRAIIQQVSREKGIMLDDDAVDHIIREITVRHGAELANYQPEFILSQVAAACKFMSLPPRCDKHLIDYAIGNLCPLDSPSASLKGR